MNLYVAVANFIRGKFDFSMDNVVSNRIPIQYENIIITILFQT